MNDVAIDVDQIDIATATLRRKQGKARKRPVIVAGPQASPSALEHELFNMRHECCPPGTTGLYSSTCKIVKRYVTGLDSKNAIEMNCLQTQRMLGRNSLAL